jgi:tRNA (Thr-GGU) A37 N-methylase
MMRACDAVVTDRIEGGQEVGIFGIRQVVRPKLLAVAAFFVENV